MRELIDKLNYYTKLYDEGHPEISDKEWDELYFKLVRMEKETGIIYPDSPTQSISYEIKDELKKVVHNHQMLSLAKTKDWNELINYFDPNKDVIGMLKLDGLTCSLRYLKGKLVAAETRGNGVEGSDILHNVRNLENVPNYICYKDELIIDGEIISTYENFEKYKNLFANPRNFAAGSIKLLDSRECASRGLIFIAWQVVKGLNGDDFYDKLFQLDELGFTTTPRTSSLEFDAKEFLINKANKLGYPIDGLVARYNDIEYGESLGATGHHVKAALAFKFYDEEYETKLRSIEWQIGRTGVATPVAIFDPVDTGDSIVSRATLHNVSIMEELFGEYPEYEHPIKICKSNEIIPKVISAEYKNNTPTENSIDKKMFCPSCGEPLVIKNENGVKTAWCINTECEGKFLNKLTHYCGKTGLDIKGISESILEDVIKWGWVESLSDLYSLAEHKEQWVCKEGYGKTSVNKILTSIENSKTVNEPWRVLSAIGIPLVGASVSKEIIKHFTIDEFIALVKDKYDFTSINGFGEEINKSILNYDYSELEKILDNYLNIIYNNSINNKLKNKTFVITGSLVEFKNRDELKSAIEQMGGKVSGSVSQKTSYLINNDVNSSSSKNKKAIELNIPIITEEYFIKEFMNDK